MCGLVGLAGLDVKSNDEKAFKDMLIFDVVRGKHSTGVAAIGTDNEWDLVKKVGGPLELFDSKQFESAMRKTNKCLIGHNRAATLGKVNGLNAHPFEFENVVGAHNGTVRDRSALPMGNKFDTDSEEIFHSINQDGWEETMPRVKGAYALTFWDKVEERVTLLRNDERTLYYCYNESNKNIYWASESWMLLVALERNNIKMDKDGVQEIKVGEALHIYLDAETKKAGVLQYEKEKFTPYVKPVTTYTGGSVTGYRNSSTSRDPLYHTEQNFYINGSSMRQVNGENVITSLNGYCPHRPQNKIRIYWASLPKEVKESYTNGNRGFHGTITGSLAEGNGDKYYTMNANSIKVGYYTEKKSQTKGEVVPLK